MKSLTLTAQTLMALSVIATISLQTIQPAIAALTSSFPAENTAQFTPDDGSETPSRGDSGGSRFTAPTSSIADR